MALVTMLDSVNPRSIPADAAAVAGYIDGPYSWTTAEWNRFATHYKLSITTRTNVLADVIDVERGDASDADSVTWAGRRRVMGIEPIVYRDQADIATNVAAFRAAGQAPPLYWVAHWTGTAPTSLPAGVIAIQYADAAMAGADYDMSVLDTDVYQEVFLSSPQDLATAFLESSLAPYGGTKPDGTAYKVGDALADIVVAISNGVGHVPGDMTVFQRFSKIDSTLAAMTPGGPVAPIIFSASGDVTFTPTAPPAAG